MVMLVMDVSRKTPAYFIMVMTQIIDENSHERRKMFASLTNKKIFAEGEEPHQRTVQAQKTHQVTNLTNGF